MIYHVCTAELKMYRRGKTGEREEQRERRDIGLTRVHKRELIIGPLCEQSVD